MFRYKSKTETSSFYCGICISPDGDHILVCDKIRNCITIFDMECKEIRSFGSKGNRLGQFWFPSGICTFGTSVFVSDHQNQRIQIFDSCYQPISEISTPGFWPISIACSREGNILVTSSSDILLFNQCGTIITKIAVNTIWTSICVNSDNQIITSEYRNGKIHVFSRDGLPLLSFNTFNQSSGCIYGICTDQKGNILVADTTNRVVTIYSPTGLLIQELKCAGPVGRLCLSGRKLITHYRHSICIFSN